MTAKTAEATPEVKPDLDVIMANPGSITLDGIECHVKRLNTREFFALMKVITYGVGGNPAALQGIDFEDPETTRGELLGLLAVAIPQAEEPFMSFVKMVVRSKDDRMQTQVYDYLDNPKLEDLLDIANMVVEQEADSLSSLMGKGKAYLVNWKKMFSKTGRGRKRST